MTPSTGAHVGMLRGITPITIRGITVGDGTAIGEDTTTGAGVIHGITMPHTDHYGAEEGQDQQYQAPYPQGETHAQASADLATTAPV